MVTATRAAYEREGFFILPSLITPGQARSLSDRVTRELRRRGPDYRFMMNGNYSGGWYLADFPTIPAFADVLGMLERQPRLVEALDDLLGRGQYRVLARSEIYADRMNTWHADALYGAIALYNNEIDVLKERCRQRPRSVACRQGNMPYAPFWLTDGRNETHRIVTIALYLQDHRHNEHGLSVKPRTHASWAAFSRLQKSSEDDIDTKLHTGVGDAIVFDCRLLHRGVQRRWRRAAAA